MVRISFAVYTTVSAATTGAKETSKASSEVKPIRIIVFWIMQLPSTCAAHNVMNWAQK